MENREEAIRSRVYDKILIPEGYVDSRAVETMDLDSLDGVAVIMGLENEFHIGIKDENASELGLRCKGRPRSFVDISEIVKYISSRADAE
jgi:acyl carrier protein